MKFFRTPGYIIEGKIGAGAFGDIYGAKCLTSNKKVAVKIEHIDCKNPQLMHECHVYRHLAGLSCVPKLYWYGYEGEFFIVIMELFGPNLEQIFAKANYNFTLNRIYKYAIEMIDCVYQLHSCNYIHRDIKPTNFVLSLNHHSRVCLIDFGLSKKYNTEYTLAYVPKRNEKGVLGTVNFTSIYSHMSLDQHIRDDAESLAYCFFYFLNGKLPWQNITQSREDKDEYLDVLKVKLEFNPVNCPPIFSKYFKFIRRLRYGEDAKMKYWKQAFIKEYHELIRKNFTST